jgi:hypothetical protein
VKRSKELNVATGMVHKSQDRLDDKKERKNKGVGNGREGEWSEEERKKSGLGHVAMKKTPSGGQLRCAQTTLGGCLAASDHYDVT